MRHFATKGLRIKVKPSRWWLGCAILAASLCWLSYSPHALNLEQKTGLRWLFHWRGPVKPPSDVVIVALDSAAAERMALPRHSSAWPRTLHAQLIQQLTRARARLIVMDIAFKEAKDETEDLALEQALATSGNVILFKYLRRHQIDTGSGLLDIEEEVSPLPRFAQHALATGSFVLPKYPAEVSRAFLFNELPGGLEPTQPLLAYLAVQSPETLANLWQLLYPQEATPADLADLAQGFYIKRQSKLPARANTPERNLFKVMQAVNPLPINFYGGPGTLHTLSIDTVLAMDEAQVTALLRNKIVYIGYSDQRQTEQQDAYRTVFSDARGVDISGVEISATIFANLLEQNYLRPPASWLMAIVCVATLIGVILSYHLPLAWTVLFQALLATAYALSAWQLFHARYLWLPLFLPAVILLLGNAAVWLRHYRLQKQREQEIRYTLSQYLPGDAAMELSRNFNRLEQQRQLVQGVCLLTDIQGYTRLAESMPPAELHSLMNRYYAVLIQAVKEHSGFIGNLVGDGMLALWTGPAISPALCNAALQTVLTIQHRLAQQPDLHQHLPTCFGLHGGQFSLGNLGSTGHFEYSPVGDMINTAARIEHLNRDLHTQMLCSGPVADELLNTLTENSARDEKLRYLGNFQLRNKALPVSLYTYAASPPGLLDRFEQALEHFQNNHFGLALAQFSQIAEEYADGPSAYYATACRQKITHAQQ